MIKGTLTKVQKNDLKELKINIVNKLIRTFKLFIYFFRQIYLFKIISKSQISQNNI